MGGGLGVEIQPPGIRPTPMGNPQADLGSGDGGQEAGVALAGCPEVEAGGHRSHYLGTEV